MIQEYHQTLKSNIRIMQTEIMKDYTFFQVGAIMLLQLFPKKQLDFSPYFSIRYFNDTGRIYKNSNLSCNSYIFYCNHIPRSMVV